MCFGLILNFVNRCDSFHIVSAESLNFCDALVSDWGDYGFKFAKLASTPISAYESASAFKGLRLDLKRGNENDFWIRMESCRYLGSKLSYFKLSFSRCSSCLYSVSVMWYAYCWNWATNLNLSLLTSCLLYPDKVLEGSVDGCCSDILFYLNIKMFVC